MSDFTDSPVTFRAGGLTIADLRRLTRGALPQIDPSAQAAVDRAAEIVRAVAEKSASVYGINTGFGKLAQRSIARDSLAELQRNLVVSHACGVGEPLPAHVVRLIIALKINSLSRGYSGVRWSLIETLLACLKHDVLPVIPAKGSVGASGDLAPLAHMAATLIGVGQARHRGILMSAKDALRRAAIEPIDLQPKEGLALLNGTQVSTALALDALFGAEDVLAASLVAAALSIEAALGSVRPFDPRIQALRGHQTQSEIAGVLRRFISGSEINLSHLNCHRIQDPYSFRCVPQVLGACLQSLREAAKVLTIEANAVTDNPLVFPDTEEVLSGGNFHAEPVALIADSLAVAIAEIGNISERRIALLVDPTFSELPAFLATNPGLESGFMIPQVTAAALASENKLLAHPASVDSIPTSAGQEDHVSMATHAAYRLGAMLENASAIVAIEFLAAKRGLYFRLPLRPTAILSAVLDQLKPVQSTGDQFMAPYIERLASRIRKGAFTPYAAELFESCP